MFFPFFLLSSFLFIYLFPPYPPTTRAQLTLYDDLRGIGSSGNGRGNFTRCHRFSFLFSPTTTTTTATTKRVCCYCYTTCTPKSEEGRRLGVISGYHICWHVFLLLLLLPNSQTIL
jgi:hypothetical protein